MADVAAASSATQTAPKSASADIFGNLGPDAFLKLLVTQMKYQNPMSPSDPTAMMGQLAQYAQVEALNKLQQSQATDQSLSEARMATDMVGRSVTASDGTTTETGKVMSARFSAAGPVLVLDTGAEVTLSAVVSVSAGATSSTPAAATSGSASSAAAAASTPAPAASASDTATRSGDSSTSDAATANSAA